MDYRIFSIFTHGMGALMAGMLLVAQPGICAQEAKTPAAQGKNLTVTFCQACHHFEGTSQAGTVGPPLVAMKARFPDRNKLRDIIYDAHTIKPHSMMPPFGRNGLLEDKQIQTVIDFLYTL